MSSRSTYTFALAFTTGIILLFIAGVDVRIVYTDVCPEFCIHQDCELFVSGKGKLVKGPCECMRNNTWAPAVYYCSPFEEDKNASYNDTHPQFLRFLPGLIIITIVCVGSLIVAYDWHEVLWKRIQDIRGAFNRHRFVVVNGDEEAGITIG